MGNGRKYPELNPAGDEFSVKHLEPGQTHCAVSNDTGTGRCHGTRIWASVVSCSNHSFLDLQFSYKITGLE